MEAHTAPAAHPAAAQMYERLGDLTRKLHEALQQLGYDKQIESSLGQLPDARTRLTFIARVTGNAAEKVLNTVDRSQERQEALLAHADRIEDMLKRDPVGTVARGDILNFIGEVKGNARDTASALTDIMLAQDFHDLTGQTVGKVVAIAAALEDSLAKLMADAGMQPAAAPAQEAGWLNGPVADASQRTDVVADQSQVDDLLESLGF